VSRENVQALRDHYAATNERDFRRAISYYADDVELVVPAFGSLKSGRITGRDEVVRWFADWFTAFDEDMRFDVEEIVDLDESSVLLIARHHARGRASGIETEGEVIWHYRLCDGKITHLETYETRVQALKAVGLEE
jgi:ketosteroid isomerase-like protein